MVTVSFREGVMSLRCRCGLQVQVPRSARDNGAAVTFGRAVLIIYQICFPGLTPGAKFYRPLRQAQGRLSGAWPYNENRSAPQSRGCV